MRGNILNYLLNGDMVLSTRQMVKSEYLLLLTRIDQVGSTW